MRDRHIGRDPRPHAGRKSNLQSVLVASALGIVQLALVFAMGCAKTEQPQGANTAAPAKSAIEIKSSAEGVSARTATAEFDLTAAGILTAALQKNGAASSLDSKSIDSARAVAADGKEFRGAVLDVANAKVSEASGKLGRLGKRIEVSGKIAQANLEETVVLEVYDDFPGLALLSLAVRNGGDRDIALEAVTLQRHRFDASLADTTSGSHVMWTFEGSSLKWGKDETFAMPAKFAQENPFGAPVETKDDLGRVGGGVPVVAFWTRNVGEAIGHIETLPLALSIPIQTTPDGSVDAAVRIPAKTTLKPGEVFSTPRTFLAIFSGDFYEPLSLWSSAIEKEGLSKPANNNENYAVSWCGWGYESNVTPKQMTDTIPKLKELGIHWATLDDRWFNNYGDWQPRADTFGGSTIQDMVKEFHAQGMKVQLWWLPLAVEDGKFKYGDHKYVLSDVVKEHPDWLVLDEKGQHARMARNLATLCPAVPEVREYYKKLTERFIRDWDFDGHKLDNVYAVPRCYNPKHHHKSPLDSVYAMGEVYKTIFETTRALKPDSVTQSCPCGTPPSLAWLRYMDQAVTADPVGSIQVRRRIKMYKALLGPRAAIYGDHVELTRIVGADTDDEQDIGDDFASTLGTGGVLGTKFTWPDYGPRFKNVNLTQEKDAHWKKWIGLYNEKMLSKGNFLDLYVYGYDVPEAYAIEKDGHMFYAFYAGKPGESPASRPRENQWSGDVELRGLEAKSYRVTDYVHEKHLGTVTGPTAKMKVDFSGSLLLEAAPLQ